MTAFTTAKPTLATHRLECQMDLSRMALAADQQPVAAMSGGLE